MRPVYLCLVVALTLVSTSWAQAAPEAGIRHILDRQTVDWNRGDVEAFMKGYENSPDTTFVGQTVEYGYATIYQRYKRLYATPAAMGKLTFSHLAIRVLDPHFATVTGNFHLERSSTGGGNADGIFSLLFRKGPAGWKIILDHSNRVG